MPASAPPQREEIRRLIGVLSADDRGAVALGETPAVADASGLDGASVVVKLSPALSAQAALELVLAARGGEAGEAACRGLETALAAKARSTGPLTLEDEVSHVRRAAN